MAVPLMGHFMLEQNRLREWIAEAKAGGAAGFEHILILHERMVLRTARRMLNDNEDAKDAAQEVFLRLHKCLNQFREDRELVPWLYRMTVNICIDLKRRRRPSVRMEDIPPIADHSKGAEEAFSQAQERALIMAALEQLSPRERSAIVLRDFEGIATREVAHILGSSEVTVRSHISSARVKIKKFVLGRLRRAR